MIQQKHQLILAVDLGTSGPKITVVDTKGNIFANTTEKNPYNLF